MDTRLQEIIAEILGVATERVDAGTSIDSEAEWDSLRHMNIIFAIEDAYGIRFEDDEIAMLTSVERIEAALAARKSA